MICFSAILVWMENSHIWGNFRSGGVGNLRGRRRQICAGRLISDSTLKQSDEIELEEKLETEHNKRTTTAIVENTTNGREDGTNQTSEIQHLLFQTRGITSEGKYGKVRFGPKVHRRGSIVCTAVTVTSFQRWISEFIHCSAQQKTPATPSFSAVFTTILFFCELQFLAPFQQATLSS